VKIPNAVKVRTEARIRRCAEEHFAGRYTRLEIRFRGQFCYIDAYTEPVVTPGWPPSDWPETQEEMIERLRNTPTFAGCATSATRSAGVSPSSPTATRSTS